VSRHPAAASRRSPKKTLKHLPTATVPAATTPAPVAARADDRTPGPGAAVLTLLGADRAEVQDVAFTVKNTGGT
jgi:hypothetical protein